jgi:D-glycero-alpha-D-manno-heptose-7-phosphate kinase
VETHPAGDIRVKLISLGINRSESFASLEHLIRAKRYRFTLLVEILKFFGPTGGLTLATNSEAPAGAGIGGSSAMAVAICAALDRCTGAGRSKVDQVHISREAEAIVIHIPTGVQDHYAPAFGVAAAVKLVPGSERRIDIHVNLDEL